MADAFQVRLGQLRAGWIVRIADQDQLRLRGDQRAQGVQIHAPPRHISLAHLLQRPRFYRSAEAARQAPGLHVVRHHHDHFVAGFDEVPHRDVIGLGAPIGDLDVVFGGAGIHRRDQASQFSGAVRLRVDQLLSEKPIPQLRCIAEFLNTQRVDATLREVDLHAVFPRGLHALHRELF
jgi:hypothetical protein